MGLAIARGILKKKLYKKSDIIGIETKKESAPQAVKIYNKKLSAIILAVKPKDIDDILIKIKNIVSQDTVIVSIAAGINIKRLSNLLLKNQPIARIMPNTPCQISEGMSVITFNKFVSKAQRKTITTIFKSIGKTVKAKESQFDLIGAVNGSGPAYFCYLIESMIKSGTRLGLNKKITEEMVLQTAFGTTLLLSMRKLTPQALRESVTSKKGITEAALKVLKKRNFDSIVHSAILAAKNRSVELGKEWKNLS